MRIRTARWRLLVAGVLATSVVPAMSAAAGDYDWRLPAGFPRPVVPVDNPMSAAKVELGRRLFYDARLSGNGSQSCGSCHQQTLAFSDGRPRAVGATGQLHPRSAMSLTNVAYNAALTWSAPRLRSLEAQIRMPLFARQPIEMGLTGAERRLENELARDPALAPLFARAFAGEPRPIRVANVERAVASFERTLVSGGSPYDELLFQGDREALNPEARRGMELFFSPRLGCSRCHSGFNLSGPVVFAGSPSAPPVLHNTNLQPAGAVAERRRGPASFRAPTLRNVAVTAPYMHDGSLATLEEVIEHYAAGGRARPVHPGRSPLIRGFELTAGERSALVRFLESLTDRDFLSDSRFGPPG